MNYNPIANGDYIYEHKRILKDLCTWKKMTEEERRFFTQCDRCKSYRKYAQSKMTNTCPCPTCKHHKTEIEVDNRMRALRRKYLQGGI